MNQKTLLVIISILGVALLAGAGFYYFSDKKVDSNKKEDLIKVENPQPNQEISSPFVINGEARGYWFFEASFPIKLLDENGNVIEQTFAQAKGDWMTEDFVPFESTLIFSVLYDQNGTLVLEKDNPSGLPENNDEIRIPVRLISSENQINFSEIGNIIKDNPGLTPDVWYLSYEKPGSPALIAELKFVKNSTCKVGSIVQPCEITEIEIGDRVEVSGLIMNNVVIVKSIEIQKNLDQLRVIKLYYYNSDLDKDSSGNILCSEKGLVSVDRQIPITNTPIQDTIKLLLLGDISSNEKELGIGTEYPLDGFKLVSASLKEKVLTLTFDDPNNKTGGGSCRAGILWSQINKTALQFEEVSTVKFIPEELFQP